MRTFLTVAFLSMMLIVIGITYWTSKTVQKVHTLVNSRMTSVLNRVDQLTRALKMSGIKVPDDPDEPESERLKHHPEARGE